MQEDADKPDESRQPPDPSPDDTDDARSGPTGDAAGDADPPGLRGGMPRRDEPFTLSLDPEYAESPGVTPESPSQTPPVDDAADTAPSLPVTPDTNAGDGSGTPETPPVVESMPPSSTDVIAESEQDTPASEHTPATIGAGKRLPGHLRPVVHPNEPKTTPSDGNPSRHDSPYESGYRAGYQAGMAAAMGRRPSQAGPYAPPGLPHGYQPHRSTLWELRLPRIWPSITATCCAMGLALIVSIVALLLYAWSRGEVNTGRSITRVMVEFESWVQSLPLTVEGILLITLPGQTMFLGIALLAAIMSPVGFRQRLGLVASRYPWWSYLLFAVGSPVVVVTIMLLSLPFRHLTEFSGMNAVAHGPPGLIGLVATLFAIALMPTICEELLFRGLLQRRLVQRWHPVGAMSLAGTLFLVAHFNIIQGIVLIPITVWISIIAWQSGSVFPPMLCHLANNAAAILLTRWIAPEGEFDVDDRLMMASVLLLLLLLTTVAMLISIVFVIRFAIRHGAPTPQPLPDTVIRTVRVARSPFNPLPAYVDARRMDTDAPAPPTDDGQGASGSHSLTNSPG